MVYEPNLESMIFYHFSNNDCFGSNQDPDVNFLLGNISSLNIEYFPPSDIKIVFSNFESPDTFSVPHLNIRSRSKIFKDFKGMYKALN